MLIERFRKEWQDRERTVQINSTMCFSSEGLVLGAGTVLLPAYAERRRLPLAGQEVRVLALLSAVYGRAVTPAVLCWVDRAAKSWGENDDCLAGIHLALTGLHRPKDERGAARRLFMADVLMEAGTTPRMILHALGLDTAGIDAVEKAYNPAQPRVPAGSGDISGQWTSGFSVLSDMGECAALQLGRFAARFGGPAAAFGLLFVPSANKVSVSGAVPDFPGLHYAWNTDQTTMHLTYDATDGTQRTLIAELDADDLFHDSHGKVIGRALPGGSVVIDPAAISTDLAQKDEPNFCPAPTIDKAGRGAAGEKDRDYEDYVKQFVNPDNPTPRGWGVQLPNLMDNGKPVFFDDCQRSTGTMIEMKGTGYAALLAKDFDQFRESLTEDWLDQSRRQINASAGRPNRWYFAEPEAAEFAREIFNGAKKGREQIELVVLPWQAKTR